MRIRLIDIEEVEDLIPSMFFKIQGWEYRYIVGNTITCPHSPGVQAMPYWIIGTW
jgi:hypothetical protein